MFNEKESIIFTRHTKRADGSMGYGLEAGQKPSENYPHITIEGEEKTREIARLNFKKLIEQSVEGSILFIGGASEEERTKETAEVIGDELKECFQNDAELMIFTKKEMDDLGEQAKAKKTSTNKIIRFIIENNPNKKMVFTFPFYLKEFSLRSHHREKETGKHTDYMLELLEQTNYDERAAALEWFKNNGTIKDESGKTFKVPTPQETAETHISGINRLKSFAKKFAPDRSINIGIVGHGWQLDALALYIANKGKVDAESFERVFGNQLIQQPETGVITFDKNRTLLEYKEKTYEI